MIMQFTQNPAVSEPRPGGNLMMYGGMIDATYVNLEANKFICLKWRFKDWGDQYANVMINFEEDDDDVSDAIWNFDLSVFQFFSISFKNF